MHRGLVPLPLPAVTLGTALARTIPLFRVMGCWLCRRCSTSSGMVGKPSPSSRYMFCGEETQSGPVWTRGVLTMAGVHAWRSVGVWVCSGGPVCTRGGVWVCGCAHHGRCARVEECGCVGVLTMASVHAWRSVGAHTRHRTRMHTRQGKHTQVGVDARDAGLAPRAPCVARGRTGAHSSHRTHTRPVHSHQDPTAAERGRGPSPACAGPPPAASPRPRSLTSAAWMMKCRSCPSHSTLSTYSCLPWLSRTRKSPLQLSSSCTSRRGMAPWYQTCWHSGFCTSGMRGTGGGSWTETEVSPAVPPGRPEVGASAVPDRGEQNLEGLGHGGEGAEGLERRG